MTYKNILLQIFFDREGLHLFSQSLDVLQDVEKSEHFNLRNRYINLLNLFIVTKASYEKYTFILPSDNSETAICVCVLNFICLRMQLR